MTAIKPVFNSYSGVQALRGVAAVMVVAYHASQMYTQHAGDGAYTGVWHNGASGVDVFFIISGFVMAVSTLARQHKLHPARAFLERRLVRLVPLYWICSLIVLLKLWFVHGHSQFANSRELVATPWNFIVASFLFIPYSNSLGAVQPILYVGWSLSFEMLFYLLFALALALRVSVVGMLVPTLLGMVVIGCFHTATWPTLTVLLQPYLLEFLAGLLLGQALLRGWSLDSRLAAALGFAGAAALFIRPVPGTAAAAFLVRSIAAYLMVQAVVLSEHSLARFLPRRLLLLGDASYSLYLVHPLVFTSVVKLLSRLRLLEPGTARLGNELETIALAVTISCLVAVPVYLLVERPMTLWLRRHVLHEKRVPIL